MSETPPITVKILGYNFETDPTKTIIVLLTNVFINSAHGALCERTGKEPWVRVNLHPDGTWDVNDYGPKG